MTAALRAAGPLDLDALLQWVEDAQTARRQARALVVLVEQLAAHPAAEGADGSRVLSWAVEQMEAHHAAAGRSPLAYAEPWAPRCNRCGAWDPVMGELASPEMTWTGEGAVHECPCCGVREARTSQRLALRRALVEDADYAFILGGNRTGKSEGAAQLCAAVTLGRDDPGTREWVRSLGIDLADISLRKLPEGAGLSYAIALTSHDSLQYVRPKLARYLPAGTRYRAWTGNQQAEARTEDGGKVVCKSVDQGRRAMQGAAARFVWPDEEIDGKEAIEIMEELDARLTDANGWMVLSMTPLKGWTPMLERYVKTPRPDVLVSHLSVLDNPYIERASVVKRLARYGERIRLARERGTITAIEGAVHPDFDRAVHVVPAFPIPTEWPRLAGIDFGVRDPFVHLWCALGPDEVVHVYREHYKRDDRLRDHARVIWEIEGCPDCMPPEFGSDKWQGWTVRVAMGEVKCDTCDGTGRREPEPDVRWADAAGLDQRRTLSGEYGIVTAPAHKDRAAGFDVLDEAMQLDAEGRPHFVVHDCCTETIRELEGIRWNDKRVNETATIGDDHAWDTLRYVLLGARRAGYLSPPPALDED